MQQLQTGGQITAPLDTSPLDASPLEGSDWQPSQIGGQIRSGMEHGARGGNGTEGGNAGGDGLSRSAMQNRYGRQNGHCVGALVVHSLSCRDLSAQ